MNKHILIACYYFPPYPGIGGRRTAKFCKYLVKQGYILHIIKVENPHKENSHWLEDIAHENIHTYSLPLNYPTALLLPSDGETGQRTLLQRISFKLSSWYHSRTQKKRIYDPTFRWEKQFTKLASSLIRKFEIRNFIVSVSPHYYAQYSVRLKKEFPGLNIIIDFRDPWLTLRDYGLQSMTPAQKENESAIVREVVQGADYLISPSKFVLDEFRQYVKNDTHFLEVPHAYDEDDINGFLNPSANKTTGKTKLLYAGTLYSDILPSLLKIGETLSYLKKNNSAAYEQLEIDFYVPEVGYADYFKAHPNVKFHKPIGKAIFEKIQEASALLILYAGHNKNYRTTKFYEYLPFKKNYLYIGPKGDTYEFILRNQLGYSFTDQEEVSAIAGCLSGLTKQTPGYDPKIDYHDFSFKKQTEVVIGLFKDS